MTKTRASSQYCELCGRSELELTQHHLIPRTRHKNKRIKREFSREEILTRKLSVCRPCHKQVHTVLSEKELALHYNTRNKLLHHPQIKKFVSWIADKPGGTKPKI